MAPRAPKICNAPGCAQLLHDPKLRYCPQHGGNSRWQQRTGTPRTATTTHKGNRNAILDRDGHRCQLRYDGCIGVASILDHIIATAFGGSETPKNLQSACGPCHDEKTQHEARYGRGLCSCTPWKPGTGELAKDVPPPSPPPPQIPRRIG